jgi:heparan-alpha-glucosaminide N-acetyltransferase
MGLALLALLVALASAEINTTFPSELDLDMCKLAFVWAGPFVGPVTVWGRDGECHQCIPRPLVTWDVDPGDDNATYVVATTAHGYYLYQSLDTPLWHALGDRGVFEVRVTASSLTVTEIVAPYDIVAPLVVMVGCYMAIFLLFLLGYFCVYKRFADRAAGKRKKDESTQLLLNDNPPAAPAKTATTGGVPRSASRLFSIDTFRGICLAIMIFVNYGGGGYWWLGHSLWDGLTVADLVFPWFIFLMGVSISLSFSSILTRPPVDWALLLYKLVRRTAILFALGLIVNNCYHVEFCRVPGVLQRFAVSYFFTSLIVLFVPRLCCRFGGDTHAFQTERHIYLDRLLEWGVALALVALWLILTFLLPVPGCPTGYIGPGGTQLGPTLAECTGGAARYIDIVVFGAKHIYGTPTCQQVYGTPSHDPEGLLGCLTSIFICYLGAHCGRLFVAFRKSSPVRLFVHLGVCGAVLAAIGAGLAGFSQYDGVIPIIKNIWSLSFVLVMAGTGFLMCAVAFLVVDRLQWWNGAPFRQLGTNSIFIYVCHEIMSSHFPFQFFQPSNTTHAIALFDSALGVTIWTIVALYCEWIDFQVKI